MTDFKMFLSAVWNIADEDSARKKHNYGHLEQVIQRVLEIDATVSLKGKRLQMFEFNGVLKLTSGELAKSHSPRFKLTNILKTNSIEKIKLFSFCKT